MAITYCLVCNITGEKYYGSSINTLEVRMNTHISKSNNCVSKQIIQRGDYDIYQLGEYKTELEARLNEDWYIRNKECINQNRVCITDEERKQYQKQYREKNREEISEYSKQYREKNREEISEYGKQYYEKNIEKYREKNKQYREKNREEISENGKQYYEKNREKISEYQKQYYLKNREKVQCKFCGNEMFKKSLKKHQKSFHSLNFYAIFTD